MVRPMRTCIVVGAGGSLANGLYFRGERMRDTRPPLDTTFFQTVDARKIALSANLRSYLTSIGIDLTAHGLSERRMEEVFADAFFDFQENPGDSRALNAYVDLVELYLRVLRETTNWLCADGRTGAPVGRLLADAAAVSDELTIITFNHDLIVENEIHRRASLRKRWCIDQCYGTFSDQLTARSQTTGTHPLFEMHKAGKCPNDRRADRQGRRESRPRAGSVDRRRCPAVGCGCPPACGMVQSLT